MEENNVVIEDLDEFLAIPGADTIVTSSEKTVISKEEEESLEFTEFEKEKPEEIIAPIGEEEFQEETKSKSKVKNNAEVFKGLIEKGLIIPFEEDKSLEEYSDKDWEDLIKANFEEKEKELAEKTQKEFFEALPKELQMATTYAINGGTDMAGMFRALAQTQQVQQLDINEPTHHEHIVRAYLYAKNFGTKEQIEEQIEEWSEMKMLGKKAGQFKPVIDEMQEEIVKQKVAQQEEFKKQQIEKRNSYINNVTDTLKSGELSGLKIDSKRQKMLFEEMTTTKYNSMTGRPTNLLGKLLEEYQFGEKPRYDLIAEALYLLAEPDAYREAIRQNAVNETVVDTARKLKTEQENKTSTSVIDEGKTVRKTIKREQQNIFKRN